MKTSKWNYLDYSNIKKLYILDTLFETTIDLASYIDGVNDFR